MMQFLEKWLEFKPKILSVNVRNPSEIGQFFLSVLC